MKKLIVEIDDKYAGGVSITAIGVELVGVATTVTNVSGKVISLDEDCTEIKLGAEKRDV